jgi:N-acyl homoserine lactone hydrolase
VVSAPNRAASVSDAAGIDLDQVVGTHAVPADATLMRKSHDRLIALADTESARLVAGHCPVTWPALTAVEGYA